jgi:hypothetical protein
LSRQPAQKQLASFGGEWDLTRFFSAIDALKNNEISNIKRLRGLINEWSSIRNPLSHETFLTEALPNRHWMVYISPAASCLPRINELYGGSEAQRREIHKRLNELEEILYPTQERSSPKEDSDVFSSLSL